MRLRSLVSALALLFLVAWVHAAGTELLCETKPKRDSSKAFAIIKEIASYNANRDQRGMRLPVGAYTLEAEDTDYWYFRAPSSVGFRALENRKMVERELPGGIRVCKHATGGDAAGYLDSEGTTKELICEITATEFAWMEGVYWKKNF